MAVVAATPVRHGRDRQQLDRDAMLSLQPRLQRGEQIVAGIKLGNESLGGVFDSGEMSRAMLEDFPDFVDRQSRAGERRSTALASQKRVEVGQARGLLAIGAEELLHRSRRVGRGLGEVDQLLVAGQLACQKRIGKHLLERRDRAARLGLQLVRINAIDGCELQDELDGERPLVALDEVEIGGRDAESLCHGGLGQRPLHAQTADAWTGEDFLLRHGRPLWRRMDQKVRSDRGRQRWAPSCKLCLHITRFTI